MQKPAPAYSRGGFNCSLSGKYPPAMPGRVKKALAASKPTNAKIDKGLSTALQKAKEESEWTKTLYHILCGNANI